MEVVRVERSLVGQMGGTLDRLGKGRGPSEGTEKKCPCTGGDPSVQHMSLVLQLNCCRALGTLPGHGQCQLCAAALSTHCMPGTPLHPGLRSTSQGPGWPWALRLQPRETDTTAALVELALWGVQTDKDKAVCLLSAGSRYSSGK